MISLSRTAVVVVLCSDPSVAAPGKGGLTASSWVSCVSSKSISSRRALDVLTADSTCCSDRSSCRWSTLKCAETRSRTFAK